MKEVQYNYFDLNQTSKNGSKKPLKKCKKSYFRMFFYLIVGIFFLGGGGGLDCYKANPGEVNQTKTAKPCVQGSNQLFGY